MVGVEVSPIEGVDEVDTDPLLEKEFREVNDAEINGVNDATDVLVVICDGELESVSELDTDPLLEKDFRELLVTDAEGLEELIGVNDATDVSVNPGEADGVIEL